MSARPRETGFTLLEVMIAMSILAVGAASILGIFVAAVQWHSNRVENNRVTQIYNFARQHAQIAFNAFDPTEKRPLPADIDADLRNPSEARQSSDPLIREAADKFPGFRYEIDFEENEFSVSGSSVVAHIQIYRMSGKLDDSLLVDRIIMTRSGTPVAEFFSSPSKSKRDEERGRDRER